MKKILLLLFILLTNNLLANYCWVQKVNVGTVGRYAAMGFEINNKGYVGCGYVSGSGTKDFWEYDPNNNTWTQKANFAGNFIWAGAGFSIGNKGYFTLGTTGSTFPTNTYEYDPATNTWASKAAFPSNGRQDCYGFSANGHGYVLAGWKSGTYYNTLYQYDQTTNTWSTKANYPGTARSGMSGFVIGNTAYVGTGWAGYSMTDMAAYNTVTNTWSAIPAFPGNARNSGSGFNMNGKGIMGNGYDALPYNDFYEFDPATNIWTPITPFPGGTKTYTVCFTLLSHGYISTGSNGSVSTTNNQTWELTEAPEAIFTVQNSSCDSTVTINNTSQNSTTYSWNWGNGQQSTGATSSYTYNNPGTYTITLIADNGNCTDTTTQQITITFPVTASLNITNGCNNEITINNFITNATNITWLWGDGTQSTGNQIGHIYTNSGNYAVNLIISNGSCIDTLTYNVTVSLAPISSFSLTSDCNQTIHITNNSVNAGIYSWNWGNGQTGNGTQTSYSYSTPGNYTVTLIVTNGNCADTSTQQIIVSSPINTNLTLSSGCQNDINISNFVTNATSITWEWGNGQQSTGIQNTYTYPTSGSYTISLIVSNGVCTDTLTYPITVQNQPISNFAVTTNCDQSISIINNSVNSTQYLWDWGNGQTGNGPQTSYTYPNQGTYTVTLIASSGNCSDTNSVQFTITSAPVAQFSDSSACDYLHYLNQSGLNPAQNDFLWYFGDGDSSQLPTDQHLYMTSGTYNVTLIVTSSTGCTDTITKPIEVRTKATANFTPQVPTCGLQISIVNNSINSNSSLWNFGDGNFSSLNQPIHTYNNGGTFTISLVADTGICSDSTTATFLLNENPTADFEFSGGCNDTLQFQNLSSGALNYYWYFGDGDSSSTPNPLHVFQNFGNYQVILIATSAAGCLDTLSQSVTVNSQNAPQIISNIDSCNQSVTFVALGDSTLPFLWQFGDGNFSYGMYVSHDYTAPGTFQVLLIQEPNTPCADTAIASINIIPGSTTPVFIPNCFTPNNDLVNDQFNFMRVSECAVYHLQIYNRWGMKILDTYDVEKGWDGTYNGQNSPEGIYVYLITGSVEVKGFVTLLR